MTEHLSADKLRFWTEQAEEISRRVKQLGTDCCEQSAGQAGRLRAQWAINHGVVDLVVMVGAVKALVDEVMSLRDEALLVEDIPQGGICPACDGSGEGSYDGARCSHCDGLGVEMRHDEYGNII